MEVVSLCNLPVGVVAWRAAEPQLTVIVKATLSLDRDGPASLAPRQEPLSLDRALWAGSPGTLGYATDLAPRKARADVLIVGHAHAERPATVIQARLSVGDMQKSFVALALAPSLRIPLAGAYLRDRAGPAAREIHVGPRALAASGAPDDRLVSIEGPPAAPLPPRFDFGLYNVAPQDQQIAAIASDARIALDGLSPGGAPRRAQFPGIEPAVFLARGDDLVAEVPLRCDTLCIDTDRAIATLVFRGVLAGAQAEDRSTQIVLALSSPAARASWSSVRGRLAQGDRGRAVEAADLRAPRASRAPAFAATTADGSSDPAAAPALPFAKSGTAPLTPIRVAEPAEIAPPAPRIPSVQRMTIVASATPVGGELPFRPGAPDLPPPSPARAASPRSDAKKWFATTTEVDLSASEPLPFRAPDAVEGATAITPIVIVNAEAATTASIADGSAAGAVVAEAPVALETILPLDRFAAIQAELWTADASRSQILSRHAVREITWSENERRHEEGLTAEIEAGEREASAALGDALRRALDPPRARPDRDLPLEEYARARAEIDVAEDRAAALAERGIDAAEWRRLQRRWERRAAADARIADDLRFQLTLARRAIEARRAAEER